METSAYFENAIYREQSPTTTEYFDAKVPSIFVADASQSWLEVYSSHARPPAQSSETIENCDSEEHFPSNLSNDSVQDRSYQSGLDHPSEKGASNFEGAKSDDVKSHSAFFLEKLEHEFRLAGFLQTGRGSMQISFKH